MKRIIKLTEEQLKTLINHEKFELINARLNEDKNLLESSE